MTRMSSRARLLPGDASKYIRHASTEIRPGDKVVLVCRVSYRHQRQHLADQEAALRRWATARGAIVLPWVFSYEGTGWDREHAQVPNSIRLWRAALYARRHGAKILAESTDRLIRHPGYDSVMWPDARARDCDLDELAFITEGVVLATLLAPDAPAAEVRAYQTKRGRGTTGPRARLPGRLRQRRAELMPRVLEMLSKGQSIRRIAEALNLPEATTRRWCAIFWRGNI